MKKRKKKNLDKLHYMGVSKNKGTPKWMVYNGKPYLNGWFGGTTILGNIHIGCLILLLVLKSGKLTSWYGKISHCLQGFSTIPGGAGFLPSTVGILDSYQWFSKMVWMTIYTPEIWGLHPWKLGLLLAPKGKDRLLLPWFCRANCWISRV